MPGNPREIITMAERRFLCGSGSPCRPAVLADGMPR
jgi:hypothetical protein